MELKAGQKIYFMGIAGTGMAAVAGLCKEAGYQVAGSDANVYPPMSTMLESLGIPIFSPYSDENLLRFAPDLVVIANSLSRGHCELEWVLKQKIPYTSFAELIGEGFLKERESIVVAGTHGKTTTSTLLAHVLYELGEDPSFVVGGSPGNFPQSFRLGKKSLFVIEGDEYDTAFFDKESKFLHYYPDFVVFNNLEFDHADIFPDLAAIENMFRKLLVKVPTRRHIVANVDDPGVRNVLDQLGIASEVTRVACLGKEQNSAVRVVSSAYDSKSGLWKAEIRTPNWGLLRIETALAGAHNIANIAQVLGCLGEISSVNSCDAERLARCFSTFTGVRKRLDHLGRARGVDVYEDFAHHPTAVDCVIRGFREMHPGRRLVVAFEPRNASSRRNVFSQRYVEVLGEADVVLMGACFNDTRIPEQQRMSTGDIALGIGQKAKAFTDNEDLFDWMKTHVKPDDAVVFMSCGNFSEIPRKLINYLRE